MKKAITILAAVVCININAQPCFSPATNFNVGTNPNSVTSADFNGDGKKDLAVVNFVSSNVSVLLGTGTGSFGAAVSFAVGQNPQSVISADFNGDSKADLATANYNSDNVSVLLGTGTGSFGAATNFPADTNSWSVISADFNGDGKKDLAVANYGSSNVSVLLGTGTGSFGAATNFAVGVNTHPRSIISADFNGDAKADLATANQTLSNGNISVLLGTGTGSFGAATNFPAGTNPRSVTSADFNGDAKPDLAVTNQASSNVSVLLGTGTGSFGAATNFMAGTNPISVTSTDFNGDGIADLAVANYNSSDVSILLGTGTGSFGIAVNFAAGTTPVSVISADFNGDTKADLAVANYSLYAVSILLSCTSVGIANFSNEKEIKIYPNPTNSLINLQVKEFKNCNFELYNNSGQLIKQEKITQFTTQINTTELPDGFYILQVNSSSANLARKKLIVQH